MSQIINLTPHAVKIVREGRTLVTIEPSGEVARVHTVNRPLGVVVVGGVDVPLMGQSYGETTGLPRPVGDTLLLVSSLVRAANPDRGDLVSPGTLVRDKMGRVVGAEGLVIN